MGDLASKTELLGAFSWPHIFQIEASTFQSLIDRKLMDTFRKGGESFCGSDPKEVAQLYQQYLLAQIG